LYVSAEFIFPGPTNDINCDYLCIKFILLITTLKSKHVRNYTLLSLLRLYSNSGVEIKSLKIA